MRLSSYHNDHTHRPVAIIFGSLDAVLDPHPSPGHWHTGLVPVGAHGSLLTHSPATPDVIHTPHLRVAPLPELVEDSWNRRAAAMICSRVRHAPAPDQTQLQFRRCESLAIYRLWAAVASPPGLPAMAMAAPPTSPR